MNGKWDVDGQGFRQPPPEYQAFVEAKKRQLYKVGTQTFSAVALGTILLSWACGDLDTLLGF